MSNENTNYIKWHHLLSQTSIYLDFIRWSCWYRIWFGFLPLIGWYIYINKTNVKYKHHTGVPETNYPCTSMYIRAHLTVLGVGTPNLCPESIHLSFYWEALPLMLLNLFFCHCSWVMNHPVHILPLLIQKIILENHKTYLHEMSLMIQCKQIL